MTQTQRLRYRLLSLMAAIGIAAAACSSPGEELPPNGAGSAVTADHVEQVGGVVDQARFANPAVVVPGYLPGRFETMQAQRTALGDIVLSLRASEGSPSLEIRQRPQELRSLQADSRSTADDPAAPPEIIWTKDSSKLEPVSEPDDPAGPDRDIFTAEVHHGSNTVHLSGASGTCRGECIEYTAPIVQAIIDGLKATSVSTFEFPSNGIRDAIHEASAQRLDAARQELEAMGITLLVPTYLPPGFELSGVDLQFGGIPSGIEVREDEARLTFAVAREAIYIQFTLLPLDQSRAGSLQDLKTGEIPIIGVSDTRAVGGQQVVADVKDAGFQSRGNLEGTRVVARAESHHCISDECEERLSWCESRDCPKFPKPLADRIMRSLAPWPEAKEKIQSAADDAGSA